MTALTCCLWLHSCHFISAAKHILAVLQILSCGKQLQVWGNKSSAATYYDMIARDKQIVKVVLLLTGSIEGTKESVLEYIASFDKYKFLWQKDLATEYAAFMSTSPSLEVGSCLPRKILCNSPMAVQPEKVVAHSCILNTMFSHT